MRRWFARLWARLRGKRPSPPGAPPPWPHWPKPGEIVREPGDDDEAPAPPPPPPAPPSSPPSPPSPSLPPAIPQPARRRLPLFTLRRPFEASTHTYGRIEDAENREVCVTLEPPHIDADGDGLTDRNVSRIPAGEFEGFIRVSRKHGGTGKRDYDVPELVGVPGRDRVQVHIGNTLDDTDGCILTGLRYGRLAGKPAVLGSEAGFAAFMRALGGSKRFRLRVVDEFSVSTPPGGKNV